MGTRVSSSGTSAWAGVTNEIIHFSDGATAYAYFNELQAHLPT